MWFPKAILIVQNKRRSTFTDIAKSEGCQLVEKENTAQGITREWKEGGKEMHVCLPFPLRGVKDRGWFCVMDPSPRSLAT
uniref:Transposase n=1 Tax=Steinernema glaseri TaxID=37863 RepID=A0A1I7YGP7_9BILA